MFVCHRHHRRNELTRPIHNRTPVVLEPADWPAEGDLVTLLRPAAEGVLRALAD